MKDFAHLAKSQPCHVVYAEGEDPRILLAARQVVDEAIGSVTLIGDPERIGEAAATAGVSLASLAIIDPSASNQLEAYVALYLTQREGARVGMAKRLLQKPLYFAAMMVNAGDADLVVSGVSHSTRRVIEAAGLCIGYAPGLAVPSSCFLMQIPGLQQPIIFADCALNVDPDAETLAQIALQSAQSAERLLDETPRVALLSFSTHGSADHAAVSKVRRAVDLIRERAPRLLVDGELQADAALSRRVAEIKIKGESVVAGHANVLVFPNLDAGNIGYKLVQQFTGAKTLGPILQGFKRPVADLSRGASVEEIVAVTCVTMLLGIEGK